MNLHGGHPFWLVRDGSVVANEPLPASVDVVVVGTGITGSIVSDALIRAGFSVAVVDRRPMTMGSTAASTALLLYGLDVELGQLIKRVGEARATRTYLRVSRAIADLAELANSLPEATGFHHRDSLYLASRVAHLRRLRHETRILRQVGLDATWLSARTLRTEFDIDAPGAIHTNHAAAVDPVRLSRALLHRARSRGASLTSGVTVTELKSRTDGVDVITDQGTIRSTWCVCAMGYEIPPGIRPPIVKLHSAFAFATEPMTDLGPLARGTMLWESNRPYFYARTTDDRRLIVGGADVPFKDPTRRDALLQTRTAILERMTQAWLPSLRFEIAYSWCGTFAETGDSLPCIGSLPDAPHVLLALCAGGNGIPFASIAAELITKTCLGTRDADAEIFDPQRS